MSGYKQIGRNLHDPVTGAVVGFIDANGNEQIVLPQSFPAASPSAVFRAFGNVDAPAGNFGLHLSFQAPGDYDGVRIVLHHGTNSGTNAFKASVAAPAAMGVGASAYVPKDAAGATLSALTPVTFGGVAPWTDFRAAGGQANVLIQNSVGSGATLQEGYAVSDYISLRSIPRTDVVGAAPLFMVRLFGTNPPMTNVTEADTANANPINAVIPQFLSGYWGADYTATPDPATTINQGWMPAVSVIFYRRAQTGFSIHVAGDSLDQGWVGGTTVPQYGGNVNGWVRKFVTQMNTSGQPASLSNGALTGSKSFPFHQRAYNALLTGGLTHLFVKPWSVNEGGDGVASVPPALERTTQLLTLASSMRVVPIVIRPWAGQGIESAPGMLVQAYCDQCAARGVRVFDARAVVADPADFSKPAPQFLTRLSGGAVADFVHLNEAGQSAVAASAYGQRAVLGF